MRLPEMIESRQRTAALYAAALKGHPQLRALEPPAGGTCNYYKYVVIPRARADRAALKAFLRERFEVGLAAKCTRSRCTADRLRVARGRRTTPWRRTSVRGTISADLLRDEADEEAATRRGARCPPQSTRRTQP